MSLKVTISVHAPDGLRRLLLERLTPSLVSAYIGLPVDQVELVFPRRLTDRTPFYANVVFEGSSEVSPEWANFILGNLERCVVSMTAVTCPDKIHEVSGRSDFSSVGLYT